MCLNHQITLRSLGLFFFVFVDHPRDGFITNLCIKKAATEPQKKVELLAFAPPFHLLSHLQFCLAGMVPGIASRQGWPWPTLVASLALPLAGRFPVCESFAVRPSGSTAAFESVHVHADAPHVMPLGSAKWLGAPTARAWALASRCGGVCGYLREYLLSTPSAAAVTHVPYLPDCCCCSWRVNMVEGWVVLNSYPTSVSTLQNDYK